MKSLLHAACLTLLIPAAAAAQQPAATADDAAVRAAVGHYLQAHATGDGAHIRMAFHPALRLMWTAGDTLATRSAEEYAALLRIDGEWKVVAKVFSSEAK